MKNKFFIILIICCFSSIAFAQPVISWEKMRHDFGSFKEEAGEQITTFNFTNTGNQDLLIKTVKASCGCTSTSYTQEAVKPGEKGFVKVAFNPKNRPNEFTKTVTVTTNTEKPTTILTIEGNVIAREKTVVDLYPRDFNNLRLKKSAISFSKTLNTEIKIDSIEVINSGQKDITLSFENVPASVKVNALPQTLKAGNEGRGEKGYIIVEFDASKKNDWGYVNDRFNVIINGEKHSKHIISVNAEIVEDFSHLSKDELENAPAIAFDNTNYNFGTIKQGEKASTNFNFTNNGKSDLIIRKIKASCGCTATNPEKMIIKAGESSHITVTFNSNGKSGKQSKNINVITNDPKQSNIVLQITGVVEVN